MFIDRSAILHGIWILGFVALLPDVLRAIPMAALGGILVVTGWRLVSLTHVRHLFKHYGVLPALVWAATFVTVLTVDLLTGVLVGMGLSLLELAPHVRKLRLDVDEHYTPAHSRIGLSGAATFLSLPRLSKILDATPHDKPLTLDLSKIATIDHTCSEMISEWLKRKRSAGMRIELNATGKWQSHFAHD